MTRQDMLAGEPLSGSYRLVVSGTRESVDPEWVGSQIGQVVREWGTPSVMIVGGCRGVDSIAADWGRANGIPVDVMRADWDEHGRAAGPIRNRAMLLRGDALLAFPAPTSVGTDDAIRQACRFGLHVRVIPVE